LSTEGPHFLLQAAELSHQSENSALSNLVKTKQKKQRKNKKALFFIKKENM